MARVTRSKKINIAEDHTALTAQTLFPDKSENKPFAELSPDGNAMPSMVEDNVDMEVKGLKAAYRIAIGAGKKGKKVKGKKKGKQVSSDLVDKSDSQLEEEDADPLAAQPAKNKSKKDLDYEETLAALVGGPVPTSEDQDLSESTEVVEERKKTFARATRQQVAKTHAADTVTKRSTKVTNVITSEQSIQEDNLTKKAVATHDTLEGHVEVGHLSQKTTTKSGSQTPAKSTGKTLEEVELACAAEFATSVAPAAGADDSFEEQITCRSPAKPVSRIEDSVEALDQLEEALEAIDQAALAERIVSPDKGRQKDKKRESPEIASHQKSAKPPLNPKYPTMRVKPATSNASTIKRATSITIKSISPYSNEEQTRLQPPKKGPIKRPTSLLPPKEPIKSTKPPTLPTKFELPGEAVARKLKEQREARQAQRESSGEIARPTSGPRIKSAKPTTKPSFELPGEAISRRKKEAHEARLKAQEEEERKRREFKAKPLRKSIVPNVLPRDTATSRARQSKIGLENMDSGNLAVTKRLSNIGAHRPSITQKALANMSVTRSPGPALERKLSTKAVGPSTSGLVMQRSVSSSDVQAQRQRAKEIYNRDIKQAEDFEREKREREAAAKRSREEAAERGRQASREWAEKMRARKMAEGDKGMGIRYGPGGQMGLKG